MKSFISPFKKVIFFSFILLMIFAGKESGCGCEDESKLQFFQLGQGNPGGNGLGTLRGEEEIGQSQKGKRIDESENASLFQPETKSDFFTQISSASNASGSNTNGSPTVESPLLSQNFIGQGNPGGNGLGTSRGEEEIGQSQKGKRIDESENAS